MPGSRYLKLPEPWVIILLSSKVSAMPPLSVLSVFPFPSILRVKEKAPTLRQEPLVYDKIPPRNLYRPVEIALPHVVKP
jgi:hypothetical protein